MNASGKRGFGRKRLLCCLLLFTGTAALAQSISLSLKNAPLEKAFRQIELQSPYRFSYAAEALEGTHPVTVELRKESIGTTLKAIFLDQPLVWSLDQNFILVRPKEDEQSSPVNTLFTLTGSVRGENGEALAGASVEDIKTGKATATDGSGHFTLEGMSPAGIIEVSSVGYRAKRISLQGKNEIAVRLSIAVSTLDETVVIAYGTTTNRMNTGSVSKVTGDEISSQPVSNPLAALEGRVPGMVVTQGNGLPGSHFSVLIGGRNSIQNGTDPLYIIDGVPLVSEKVSQRGASYNANNPFNTINPLDIESIEILKDADATAIYGSRGANGVILITTKKGKAGKTSVETNVYTGWGKLTRTVDYLNTQQYIHIRREAFANDGIVPAANNAPDLLAWDTTRYTNFKKLLIGNTSHTTNAQIRFSGGNAFAQFSLGGNYYKETTVFPGEFGNRRASISFNASHASSDKKFHVSITGSYGKDRSVLPSPNVVTALSLPPDAPALYDASGSLNWKENGASFSNPMAYLLQTYKGTNERLTSHVVFNYKVLEGLSIKASIGFNSLEFTERSQTPILSQNPANNPKGSASFGLNKFETWIAEPQIEYSFDWGKKGKFQALAGATWQQNEHEHTLLNGNGYQNDALLPSISGAASVTATNGYSQYRYEAVFGRLNYNRDRKYIVNLTGRRDGSSRFGPGKQFANFGAIGAAWIFSEEKYLKNAFSFLSYGKMRASYGITGNDQIGDYQYLDNWTNTQYPYQGNPSLQPLRIFNPTYNWEANKKLEAAIELGFLEDRVLVTAAWYRAQSDNQLIAYTLPAQTGFQSIIKNFPGAVRNTNWEFEVQAVPIKREKFNWKCAFNFTLPDNKLLSFPGLSSSSYATTYLIGKPLNASIGYRFLGIDRQTGVYVYEDVNKDGFYDAQDFVYNGTTNPVFYGGLQNNLQYGSWRLDFLFSFTKQKGSEPLLGSFNQIGSQKNFSVRVLDHWQQPGDDVPYQKLSQDFGSPATNAGFLIYQSGAALTDASFVRLKNVALSYNFPEAWLKKLRMDNCRFYLEGQNLFTKTNYAGADPESQNGIIPPLRTLVTGIQITF